MIMFHTVHYCMYLSLRCVYLYIGVLCNRDVCTRDECTRDVCTRGECTRDKCTRDVCTRDECTMDECTRDECTRDECTTCMDECTRDECTRDVCTRDVCTRDVYTRDECTRDVSTTHMYVHVILQHTHIHIGKYKCLLSMLTKIIGSITLIILLVTVVGKGEVTLEVQVLHTTITVIFILCFLGRLGGSKFQTGPVKSIQFGQVDLHFGC